MCYNCDKQNAILQNDLPTYLSYSQYISWLFYCQCSQCKHRLAASIQILYVCASGIGNNLTTVDGADTEVRTYNTFTP